MKRSLCLLQAAIVAGLASGATGQQFIVIDLGESGGPVSFGFGVNRFGQAVGAANPYNNHNFHGMFFSGWSQGFPPLAGDTQCWGMTINNAGAVAAMSFSLGALVPHGLLWQNGALTSLGDFTPRAINSAGTMAGSRSIADATYGRVERAATWSLGAVNNLPTLGGSSGYAAGINDTGQVVGWSLTARDLQVRAVLWQGGVARDLGTLGGARSQAYAINNSGKVAGFGLLPSGTMHAMLITLDAGGNVVSRTDLGALGGVGTSIAYAINSSSQIVGTSNSRAVIWPGSGVVDLNTRIGVQTNWLLQRAWSISDAGHIVGSGVFQGTPHAFLLVPACYANCDGSTEMPLLTANDFACFLNAYASGQSYADCDGVGGLTANDFACFLNAYANGCS